MEENQHKLRVVPHLDSSSALVFPVMEFTLSGSAVVHIGRSITIENNKRSQPPSAKQMTFRSKVVSRTHAEIFVQGSKVYIRDLESSSGTFLNSRRLCGPNQRSQPFQLHDNDIIQLGVDYQGGTQEIYRAVKMRLELNKNQERIENMNRYNLQTYNSLRNLATPPSHISTITQSMERIEFGALGNSSSSSSNNKQNQEEENEDADEDIHVDECCICLFAIAPFQALFVAPCSHTFHYKCLRPLLLNHPGFACPLCRNYADLDASVSLEVEEVKSMLKTMKKTSKARSQDE
ncbi:SMAD/FHA domain-containing protein [Mucor ambiguus]|uniref:SMAD/FHA domain-containing protein n=1 Tax=Mucor ambiguus TaxID=91626 RepID=A0A0C9MHM3_9FUNG|nr:SMAD/FHA domain-containing protein [Mucor ambiguus]